MDSYDDFKKYFGSSKSGKFWKIVTTKSLIPLEDIPDKETLLEEIFSEIESSKYAPSKPRGYISIDKGSCVTRLLPVFNLKDICVYFYATKKLEKDIAGNRVQNTYGGWSLGGEIRKNEEEEVKYIAKNMREYEMPDGTVIGLDESLMYPIEASFNPRAWSENWINFTGTLYTHSRADKYNFVAELDIANFYDNISIEILEDKLGEKIKNLYFTQEELEEIDARTRTDLKLFENKRQKELDQLERKKKVVREDLEYLRANKLTLLKTGAYSPQDLLNEENALNAKLNDLHEQEQMSDQAIHEVVKDLLKLSELLENGAIYWDNANSKEKERIARIVFSELLVSENNVVFSLKDGFKPFETRIFSVGDPTGNRTPISRMKT